MFVLELIWDNLKNATGKMFLYGTIAFLIGMLILFLLNKIGGLTRKTVSGKALAGCYYFLVPFVLSLGFAMYGGIKGAKEEVIRDMNLAIDESGKQTLGRFDKFLKEKGFVFKGHGYDSDSVATLFLSSINVEKDSWKGELIHWTVTETYEQVEARVLSEASGRTGVDKAHVDNLADYLENGKDGEELNYVQELGTGIAKTLISKKVAFWVNPYMYAVAFFTILIALLPISHCIIHILFAGNPKKEDKEEVKLKATSQDNDLIDFR